ncbi:DedA family protein [Rummeliibacillus sp. NPDC094406]|uniref:DedA family protein n=1 Tax=Rummeliibacillus sp. NPDC094406 TaxID=3364511 RepID=UPI00380BCC5B
MEQHLDYLIEHYGYFGIIIVLIGGIIGLPIPDEVLLTYVGYNVFQGKLSYIISLTSAFIGAAGGISLSYFVGYKFGLPLLKKFGPKFHITEDKIDKTGALFNKIGPVLLLIGYFIPGVRHLTAYIAAIDKYPFKKFVGYAYTGALLWSITFITLGKILGEEWHKIGFYLSKYHVYPLLVIVLIVTIIVYLFLKKKSNVEIE